MKSVWDPQKPIVMTEQLNHSPSGTHPQISSPSQLIFLKIILIIATLSIYIRQITLSVIRSRFLPFRDQNLKNPPTLHHLTLQ